MIGALTELAAAIEDVLDVLKGQQQPWSLPAVRKAEAHLARARELAAQPQQPWHDPGA